jgi:hypothetical protein
MFRVAQDIHTPLPALHLAFVAPWPHINILVAVGAGVFVRVLGVIVISIFISIRIFARVRVFTHVHAFARVGVWPSVRVGRWVLRGVFLLRRVIVCVGLGGVVGLARVQKLARTVHAPIARGAIVRGRAFAL